MTAAVTEKEELELRVAQLEHELTEIRALATMVKYNAIKLEPGDKLLISSLREKIPPETYKALKDKIQNFVGHEIDVMLVYGVHVMVANDKSQP